MVSWGQGMSHLPITSETKPFLGKGMARSHQGYVYNCIPVTDMLGRKVFIQEPKRKVNPGIDIICCFSPQTGQYWVHLVVPKGMSWLQK